MKPSTLHARLKLFGYPIGPSPYPPGSPAHPHWLTVAIGGHVFELPAREDAPDAPRHVRSACAEIRELAGLRLDWPVELDEVWDRCQVCGGAASFYADPDGSLLARCAEPKPCREVCLPRAGRPTMAELLTATPYGRAALRLLGHPLGEPWADVALRLLALGAGWHDGEGEPIPAPVAMTAARIAGSVPDVLAFPDAALDGSVHLEPAHGSPLADRLVCVTVQANGSIYAITEEAPTERYLSGPDEAIALLKQLSQAGAPVKDGA